MKQSVLGHILAEESRFPEVFKSRYIPLCPACNDTGSFAHDGGTTGWVHCRDCSGEDILEVSIDGEDALVAYDIEKGFSITSVDRETSTYEVIAYGDTFKEAVKNWREATEDP